MLPQEVRLVTVRACRKEAVPPASGREESLVRNRLSAGVDLHNGVIVGQNHPDGLRDCHAMALSRRAFVPSVEP